MTYHRRPFYGSYARNPARERALKLAAFQHYDAQFVTPSARAELVDWLGTLYPLWEERYSKHHPPPPGQSQRRLLRPVYWLGSWQFACLGYYHPPKGVKHRCIRAEPFPPVMARWVAEVERIARDMFDPQDVPRGWKLNVCLVNFYGSRKEGEKWIDTARVGEHKDFEPGPVASISIGERALFQFVASSRPGQREAPVHQQWLDDGSLQIFGGERLKKHLFHRVQRVDHKAGQRFSLHVQDFETRRVNLTFRYVPDSDVVPYAKLPSESRADVLRYMQTLAKHSPFFARELSRAGAPLVSADSSSTED